MNTFRFDVLPIDAGVANMRISQRYDLAAVARVGEDFLITGHRGVEHHLTDRAAGRTDSLAKKYRPVGKR